MKIQNIKIENIKPYENNPRFNDGAIEATARSIEEFGWQQPLVLDKDNVIICGHTRFEAAKTLGYKEIPCVIATNLTEEQVKAYRLVDNKTSELAEWNFDLLIEEIAGIEELNLEEFGFNINIADADFSIETSDSNPSPIIKGDEQVEVTETGGQALLFHDTDRTEGWFQMPTIQAVDFKPSDLIGFNYVLNTERRDAGIHFYLDDYQFERIWNNPKYYIPKLKEFECSLTPDFSLYMEMSMATKIWNIYRSRLVGQMMQDYGVTVIPTISWAEPETYKFCFDGIEPGGTVSISTIGVKRTGEARKFFDDGCNEMIKRLQPKRILLYGGMVDFDWGDIEVIAYDNHVTDRLKESK